MGCEVGWAFWGELGRTSIGTRLTTSGWEATPLRRKNIATEQPSGLEFGAGWEWRATLTTREAWVSWVPKPHYKRGLTAVRDNQCFPL